LPSFDKLIFFKTNLSEKLGSCAGDMAAALTLSPYPPTPDIYNSLGHIDAVGGRNIDQAVALTQHLLQKAGLTPLVGVSRLHKHFDLAADEVIVSMLSNDRSEITTSVRKAGELHGGVQNYIPMTWAFRDGAWQRVQVLLVPPAEAGIQGNATIDFTILAAECEAQLGSLLNGAAGFDAAAAWKEFSEGGIACDVGVSLRFIDLMKGINLDFHMLVERLRMSLHGSRSFVQWLNRRPTGLCHLPKKRLQRSTLCRFTGSSKTG
jgi:hypothetical protein